jgi:pyruvate ferredoxin oxidoreductase alpha subunit
VIQVSLAERELKNNVAKQRVEFLSGNEMAAEAASQINFHIMGYYPITPSTEIAEILSEKAAVGEHNIKMIPADGEHGAAGICFGATTGGGRVFNATSANGLLYAIEQLPVQSGTRFPMVLDLVTRTVSGPLDIRGDHSDLYYAINTGWIVLLARDPQAVYDMNILAVRIGEHPEVRLPVIVAYDGFFTSHQKRRVECFEDKEVVQQFIGKPISMGDALDAENPVTIGPYMNDPDLINNKYQLHKAMEAAKKVIPELFAEYAKISGRNYAALDLYRMEDAEVAVFLLNSAAETAKDVADQLRAQGIKAGVISPNVIRPFPTDELIKACRNLKVLVIGDRSDIYGSSGGAMGHEVQSALKSDQQNNTLCINRIYGLGGKEFYPSDVKTFFDLAIEAAKTGKIENPFDYHGVTPGNPNAKMLPGLPAITLEESYASDIKVELDEKTNKLNVKLPPLRELTRKPKRIAPGHGTCPGCGIFSGLNQVLTGIQGDVVLLFQTGCAMVVTTGYPVTSHRVSYVHNLFQSGGPTLSGLVEMFWERKRRGEIEVRDDFTFVMVSGDGGMDIGMGPALGTALRNHGMIIVEYDNEGYMNTGSQLSYSTPMGHATSTSVPGTHAYGKTTQHKDMPQLMAATNIPYVFTGVEAFHLDLIKKSAKAQWYAKNEGMAYGKILSACPLNWKTKDDQGTELVKAAVECCFFPLYEVEKGITTITYNPEEKNKRIPAKDWLSMMGKTRHLLSPANAHIVEQFENEVERRWARLKAKHEHPLL